jgi:hypothetical protein
MLSEQQRTEAQFKCGFCGFVRALSLVELKERRLH